jgi:hypothetical protein
VYRWADLVAWAESRLGPAIRSTAELDAAREDDGRCRHVPAPPKSAVSSKDSAEIMLGLGPLSKVGRQE